LKIAVMFCFVGNVPGWRTNGQACPKLSLSFAQCGMSNDIDQHRYTNPTTIPYSLQRTKPPSHHFPQFIRGLRSGKKRMMETNKWNRCILLDSRALSLSLSDSTTPSSRSKSSITPPKKPDKCASSVFALPCVYTSSIRYQYRANKKRVLSTIQ
jgi:hypothetical protein